MKKILLLALATAFLYGCPNRINLLSPHMPPNAEHRASANVPDCRGCHEQGTLSADHKSDDDCFACHRMTPGG